jgi:PAS domain S-box-containing protein
MSDSKGGQQNDFRLLVDSIPDYAIYTLSLEGIVLTWNAGAKRIKGYEADEIIGQHFSRFYPADDRASDKAGFELKTAKEQGRFEEEGWRVRKDGSRFWANVILTPLINEKGEHIGYGKVTRDLTERRRTDARYRLLTESVKDYGIFMLDTEGIVRSWNLGAEIIKGYKPHEIIGRHFSTFYTAADIAREHPQDELRRARASGKFEEEGWRVRKDGSQFWANVVITPLIDDNGTLIGFSKVTRDLTTRMQTDKTLRESQVALKKAYDELESFSYSVSHDLRAPLRSMDGFSDILLATIGEQLDEKSRGYLQRIRESSQRMAQLIDDLLNLSRLSQEPLNIKPVSLSEIAEKVFTSLQKSQPNRKVEIRIEPDLIASADENLVRIAIENLLGNAWKYTSKTDSPVIEFGLEIAHGKVAYFVRDNGTGFDMNYKEKLFGAFQRLHAANEFPGTGIGLATVKRIIHRHGGDVSAIGTPGLGATFYFTLGA